MAGRPYADRRRAAEAGPRLRPGAGPTTSWRPRCPAIPGSASRGSANGDADDAEARHSRAEQSGVKAEHGERLRAANAAYESRFGHVFLIRAAGRSSDEILAELQRRLDNDDAAERAETVTRPARHRAAAPRAGGRHEPGDHPRPRHARRSAGRRASPWPWSAATQRASPRGTTDADGRIADLGPDRLDPGTYRLRFDTGRRRSGFFPEVVVAFVVDGRTTHLHVPLLLSPYGYSTYRGS